MVKLSIIVPIYKVENYIKQCIDSIISQTFKDIEIILVDDGSPDSCPKICDEYAQIDSRVVVLHKQNGGLSSARNAGLQVAKGEYVVFIDSDDYYSDNEFLQKIVESLNETNPQALFFQRRNYYQNTNSFSPLPSSYGEDVMNSNDIDEIFYGLALKDKLEASAAMKVIKRNFLIENELFFRIGMYSEDVEWFFRFAQKLDSVVLTNEVAYCYRKREGSISHSITSKNIEDLLFSIEEYSETIRDFNINNLSRKALALLNYLCYQYFIVIGLIGNYTKGHEKRRLLIKAKQYKWLANFAISRKTKKAKVVFRLCGIRLSTIVLGKYIANKK